jgi:2-C-methyl-D-erythritol 2,4-cyclodiphosphate synthase
MGRDFHRLAADCALVLCGVTVDEEWGCVAHSDGDCAVHALIDALLGALAEPNIGVLFPGDEINKGRNSLEMLRVVRERMRQRKFRIVNVDVTIQLERPRLAPFLDAMRQNIADALEILPSDVGIKATTAEGVGKIGQGRAMEVLSICLLESIS